MDLPIGRGDLKQHLGLVERHHGKVGARDEEQQPHAGVLHGRGVDRFQGQRTTNEREGLRERQALGTARRANPLAHARIERDPRVVNELDGLVDAHIAVFRQLGAPHEAVIAGP